MHASNIDHYVPRSGACGVVKQRQHALAFMHMSMHTSNIDHYVPRSGACGVVKQRQHLGRRRSRADKCQQEEEEEVMTGERERDRDCDRDMVFNQAVP